MVLKYAPKGLPLPGKDYLEHILARWCDAGGSREKFWRKNDEREKEFEWTCGCTHAAAIDRGGGGCIWRAKHWIGDGLGGSGGGDFAYGGVDSPGARFKGEPEARVRGADGRETIRQGDTAEWGSQVGYGEGAQS